MVKQIIIVILLLLLVVIMIHTYKETDNFYIDTNKEPLYSSQKYITNLDDKVSRYTGGDPFFMISRNNPLPRLVNVNKERDNIETNIYPLPFNDEVKIEPNKINSISVEINTEMNNILKSMNGIVINNEIPKVSSVPVYDTHVVEYVDPTELTIIKESFIKYINTKTKYTFSIYTVTKVILTMIKNDKGTIIKQFDIYLYIYEKTIGYTKRLICSFIIDYSVGTITIKNIEIPFSKEYISDLHTQPYIKETKDIKNYFKIDNILGLTSPYPGSSNLLITQDDILLDKQRQTRIKSLEKEYNCYGTIDFANITNKLECINFGGVWDSSVSNDTECPYYLANKNYYNNNGGINYGGYCEFPSGINIKGYRYYDQSPDKFNPQCYNCKTDLIGQGSIGNCCDKQKNRKEYPLLKSPDYRFQGDAPDRYNARYELSKLNLKYN